MKHPNVGIPWQNVRKKYEIKLNKYFVISSFLIISILSTASLVSADGSISGLVIEDANSNGIPDPGESGLKGWAVRLFSVEVNDTKIVKERMKTDSNGSFMFENLSDGRYILTGRTRSSFIPTGPTFKDITIMNGEMSENNIFTHVRIKTILINETIPPEVNVTPIPTMGKGMLPASLDKFYDTVPHPYFLNMLDMVESFVGIIINTIQGDTDNTNRSYIEFAQKYKNTSKMVPEWEPFFKGNAVEELGIAVNSGNSSEITMAAGKVGATCNNCHKQNRVHVWAKYNWGDFRNAVINTTDPNMPQAKWRDAMRNFIALNFDGIGVNAKEGQQNETEQNYQTFKTMYGNLKDACVQCHNVTPNKFVTPEIFDTINMIGDNISAGNLNSLGPMMEKVGQQCYQCHQIHQTTQHIKEMVVPSPIVMMPTPTATAIPEETPMPTATATPEETPMPTATATPEETPMPTVVEMKNIVFNPSNITISKGTTVEWTQDETTDIKHTVTSDTGAWEDSGILNPGDIFDNTFNDAGRFPYHCTVHPAVMKGIVNVVE